MKHSTLQVMLSKEKQKKEQDRSNLHNFLSSL